eukprot:scaffold2519_cov124-Cylindrotheca_fusiformis.AAC.4
MSELLFVFIRIRRKKKLGFPRPVLVAKGMNQAEFLKDSVRTQGGACRRLSTEDILITLSPKLKDLGHQQGQNFGHHILTRNRRRRLGRSIVVNLLCNVTHCVDARPRNRWRQPTAFWLEIKECRVSENSEVRRVASVEESSEESKVHWSPAMGASTKP